MDEIKPARIASWGQLENLREEADAEMDRLISLGWEARVYGDEGGFYTAQLVKHSEHFQGRTEVGGTALEEYGGWRAALLIASRRGQEGGVIPEP